MSAKRMSNIKADLAWALEIANGKRREGPRWLPLTEEWRLTREACPSPWLDLQLGGFVRWCSKRAIRPCEVDGDTLNAYLQDRGERRLKHNAIKLRRQIARAWNQCVETAVSWPRLKLPSVPASRRWTMPWPEFHPDFQREVQHWAEGLASVDLLDDDAPIRPLKPITIRQRRHHLQAAATILVASGVPVDELRTLQDLVRAERVAVVLNGLRQRYGRDAPTPYKVAVTMKMIARHYCKSDDQEVDRLRRLCRRVAVRHRGLTSKNRSRLLPFQDPDTRDRFLLLPGELMKSAARDGRGPRQAALLAQKAVALEIAQMAPLRAKNLAALEIGRHLVFVGHGRHEYAVISIPEEEVKNEIALEYPLPPESTRLIRHYIDTYLPHLWGGECKYLFPGTKGRSKHIYTISSQIEAVILSSIGHRVNLHLLRHFSAMIYLQAYPGAYEAVRRLLGHATASAALDFYTGFETAAAVRHFDEVILRHRRLAAARKPGQLDRRRRS